MRKGMRGRGGETETGRSICRESSLIDELINKSDPADRSMLSNAPQRLHLADATGGIHACVGVARCVYRLRGYRRMRTWLPKCVCPFSCCLQISDAQMCAYCVFYLRKCGLCAKVFEIASICGHLC